MRVQRLERADYPIAKLKFLIIRQRELAVRLFRNGDHAAARDARAQLFNMENRLEVLEEMVYPFQ
jgi:hypothetical protein